MTRAESSSLCYSLVPLAPVKYTSRQEVAASRKVAIFLAIPGGVVQVPGGGRR